MSLLVKICGITNLEDAKWAVESGADALGFMFYEKSKRHISPRDAGAIIRELPSATRFVGVFVDAKKPEVENAIELSGITTLQFHGQETPGYCQEFMLPVWKALLVHSRASLENMNSYSTEAILLDAFVPGERGGTGARFDWNLAVEARLHHLPIILAGGLTPENVSEAVKLINPFGVDVSSGVESAPGRKDRQKVKTFISRARVSLKIS
ncbi:MAG: Phosphoribosylanthranilate isomerase [Verrucomicrobiales bacterium]|jgi:phosphoribosylanthranilate isomerase|nr:Phosphoribosylanthranilate isomerase [Verrucomicrobiales bacterium]